MRKIHHIGRHEKQGFTLVEIMIALAVTGIIMSALVVVFANQHKTYIQQTDQAKAQSASRGALYMLSRDIRMAGYTGMPYGIGRMSVAGDAYAVVTLRDGATVIPGPARSTSLANSLPGGGGDAIEIWGNFSRETTTLSSNLSLGATQVEVVDPEIFKSQGSSTPGWIAVGDNQQNVEIYEVQNGDTNPIQLANPGTDSFQNDYLVTAQIFVSPIYRRVYYVDPARTTTPTGEDVSALVMRNCTGGDCSLSSNYQEVTIAEGVDELEFSYDVAGTTGGGDITEGRHMVCDPCTIRSSKIRLWTRSTAERDTPLRQDFATMVRIRNLGLGTLSCEISGCGGSYNY